MKETLLRVDSLRQEGAFRKAISNLDSLQRAHGSNVEILWRLAFTRSRLATLKKKHKQTLLEKIHEDANKALQIDSTNAKAHLVKAVAEGRMALRVDTKEKIRRSKAVKQHVNQSLALDSTLAAAYHVRGRWHRTVSDIGFFQEALAEAIYGDIPDASCEQSVRDFKRAIALDDRAYHYLELAKTYLEMSREEAARDALHTVLIKINQHPLDPLSKDEARDMLAWLE